MKIVKANLTEQFISDIRTIILSARESAIRSVDTVRVQMYWKLGERIFIEEQKGQDRAEYGAYLLQNVALEIEKEFGSGFSVRQLERARQFYRTYPIATALRTQLDKCGRTALPVPIDARKIHCRTPFLFPLQCFEEGMLRIPLGLGPFVLR